MTVAARTASALDRLHRDGLKNELGRAIAELSADDLRDAVWDLCDAAFARGAESVKNDEGYW